MYILFEINLYFIVSQDLDSKIEDAEKNLGETEIREANLARAEYLSLIGDKVLNIFYILFKID